MVFHVGARLAKTAGVYLISIPRDVELGFYAIAVRENTQVAAVIAGWIREHFPAELRVLKEPEVEDVVKKESDEVKI